MAMAFSASLEPDGSNPAYLMSGLDAEKGLRCVVAQKCVCGTDAPEIEQCAGAPESAQCATSSLLDLLRNGKFFDVTADQAQIMREVLSRRGLPSVDVESDAEKESTRAPRRPPSLPSEDRRFKRSSEGRQYV